MPQVLANGWCCLPGMVAVSDTGALMLCSMLNSDTLAMVEEEEVLQWVKKLSQCLAVLQKLK